MDKQTARRRQAAREARPRASQPDEQLGAAHGDESLLAGATPTGVLSAAAEDELDPLSSAELAEQRMQQEADRQSRLDAFAASLAKKRMAAVLARQQSGIEDIWSQDEEFYEGIDDANRDEHVTLKPRNQTGGASVVEQAKAGEGSNVFVNITRAYVDFSAGRAADMLLPTDDANWDLRETPMPDIIAMLSNEDPIVPPAGFDLPPDAPKTYGAAAAEMYAKAKAQVGKAKKRIEDWLEEGQYYAEQRKVLRDAAKVGVGILKGPFPSKRMARAITRGPDGQVAMQVQNKLSPLSRCISYRNFFPDHGCGEDIHSGSYVWEKDSITARKLRDLIGTKDADGAALYIESSIDTCLKEGPQRKFEGDTSYNAPDAENFEIWYFNGVATAEDLRAAGIDADEGEVIPVMVTMVNDRVIKAALSTLDSGEFPYDVMVWQEREGHWAGIGVARQVRTPQRIVNAGVRNLMDNAGLAAGAQFIIAKEAVKPMGKSQVYGISPRKMWEMAPDSGFDDVRKAFAAIELPMLSAELLSIVQFGLKMAEDVTGLPMLMQGQQGQASDTVGGMTILNNNSNTPLRAIAKFFDDRITVPHLLRYYEWLLMYGPDDSEKGEFVVAARGSSALFERDAQNQAILQMAPIVKDPAYKINPEKWFKEFLRAQRLDADRFQYSEAEWSQVQQQMQQNPPPVDPRLQAAEIAAKARVETAQIAAGVQKDRIAKDTDRDTVYVQAEQQRAENDHQARMAELAVKRELALLDYANREKQTLEQVKAELAGTAMKLQTQKELSAAAAGLDLHKHHNPAPQVITPPTEPVGRAPAGEAFQA